MKKPEEACWQVFPLAWGGRVEDTDEWGLGHRFHSFTTQSSVWVSNENSRQPLFASEGCREEENRMLLLKLYLHLGV